MQFPASLLLLASWLPKPGPGAAASAANQNVLANPPASAAAPAAIESPPPPPSSATTTNSSSSSSSPWSCPPLSHRPLTVAELSTTFPPRPADHLSAAATASIEAIRRQLTLYAFAIDGRDWAALDHVFAPHATADYGPPINSLSGRDAIRRTLPPYLTVFAGTQHVLGTQVVDLCGEGDEEEAVSVSYFTAAHFKGGKEGRGMGAPVGVGEVVYAFGQYQDRWERDGGDGVWRIVHRNLVYMGPFVSGA